jgi:hypothetical protein
VLVEAHRSALRAAGVRIETLACVGTEHSIDEEGSATVQADDNGSVQTRHDPPILWTLPSHAMIT